MPRLLRFLLLAGLLAACSNIATPAPTAQPLPTVAATTAAATPTNPPEPSATAAATATQAASAVQAAGTTAAGNTAAGTAAGGSTATATGSSTAAPSLTPTPGAINPLTGLPVSDPAALDRRPLAVKIANFPRRVRAAQTGLSVADNVWEHYAEGGTTRFTAIFLSQGPDRIGNVRSARLIDAYLGQAYQAMLVASGSSDGTLNRLKQTDFFPRVIAEATGYHGCPILCREAPASQTTDKLFTSAPAVWGLATSLGLNGHQDLPGFAFDPQPPGGGRPVATAHVDWQVNNTVAEWRYDAGTQSYARWIDTENMPTLAQHVDSLNGQALSAANVVVVYANYVTSNIHESDSGDKLYFSYDIELYGSGPAKLFRDGQMYDLTWTRDKTQGGLPRFTDASGNVVPFRPGNIWFEAVSSMSVNSASGDTFIVRVHVPDPTIAATQQP
jgi:hypothetical protein